MSYEMNESDTNNMKWLAQFIRNLNSQGHNPATSGNYSFRSSLRADVALISESGIDKSIFLENNFLPIDIFSKEKIEVFQFQNKKASDETDIHLAIYQTTNANCVLHSHLLESILFAELFPTQSLASIFGLELLKGFSGVKSHETQISIPFFENSQNMLDIANTIGKEINKHPSCYGFILRGHGLYVWGDSLSSAKRHLEVFEYIFKYFLQKRNLGCLN